MAVKSMPPWLTAKSLLFLESSEKWGIMQMASRMVRGDPSQVYSWKSKAEEYGERGGRWVAMCPETGKDEVEGEVKVRPEEEKEEEEEGPPAVRDFPSLWGLGLSQVGKSLWSSKDKELLKNCEQLLIC